MASGVATELEWDRVAELGDAAIAETLGPTRPGHATTSKVSHASPANQQRKQLALLWIRLIVMLVFRWEMILSSMFILGNLFPDTTTTYVALQHTGHPSWFRQFGVRGPGTAVLRCG
jgi:hypothetical protein